MKKLAIFLLVVATTISAIAQNQQPAKSAPKQADSEQSAPNGKPTPTAKKEGNLTTYKAFIYTSSDLAEDIQKESIRSLRRGGIADAALLAAKGLAGGYVTSFLDLGVNAIASLVTRSSRQKAEWEEMIAKENSWTTTLGTITEVNDFYKETSFSGAMDPAGMKFDGIGCLRTEGSDTVFYVSCHIDRTKLHRIVDHSKFELVLDTLIISPTRSNLPNTSLDIPFSFEERRNFMFSMNIKLTSSWINYVTQIQNDEELGTFTINVPVDQDNLDKNGFLRYVRNENEPSRYQVEGESFIVPRSYMGYRDQEGGYKDSWGTGQYKLSIELKETCDITDEMRENWKQDRKRREKMQPKKNFFDTAWQTIAHQEWDEISQTWIVTILQGPASVISSDFNAKIGLPTTTQTGAAGAKQGQGGGQAQGSQQPQGGQQPSATQGGHAPQQSGQQPQGGQPEGGPQPH